MQQVLVPSGSVYKKTLFGPKLSQSLKRM
jgi:hypothetical protein